jgi:hypothetical protein
LGEKSPQLWLEKLDFIQEHFGMALVIVHPDYLFENGSVESYRHLLEEVRKRRTYWNALPREVAAWWRSRSSDSVDELNIDMWKVKLVEDQIVIQ